MRYCNSNRRLIHTILIVKIGAKWMSLIKPYYNKVFITQSDDKTDQRL
jgi:hypothetical protein